MPWTFQSNRDGFTVADIPDSVEMGSPEFVQMIAKMRETGDSIATAAPAPDPQAGAGGVLADVASGLIRGASPIAGGAALGGGIGALAGGVGAIPGAVLGAGIMAGTTLIGDPAAQLINSIAGEQIVTSPTESINGLLDQMGLPRPGTAAGRVAQAASQGASGAGGMANAGKILTSSASPVVRAVGANLAANMPGQILGGITGGAASQGVAEAGGGQIAQLGAGILGGLGGGSVGGRLSRAPTSIDPATGIPLPPATAARVVAMRDAEALGIPVRTTDVFPPESYFGKFAKSVIDKMPFATSRMNATQAAARQEAVESFLAQAGARGEMSESLGKTTENLLKNRSAELAKSIDAKADVMARANEAGPVNVAATTAEIDSQIATLKRMKNAEVEPAISQLQNIRGALQDQSLDMVEANRRALGDKLKDPSVGPVVKNNLQKAATAIYRALNQDMRAHIAGALGEPDANRWAVANKRLASMLDEVDAAKSRDILSIVRKGASDPQKLQKILFNGTDSDLRTAYRYLDNEGRAAARRAYVDKAIDVATNGRGLDAAEQISVDKFKNALQIAIKRSGPFFEGKEGKAAKGLIRALDLTAAGPRANQLAQTGAMNAPALIGTALGGALGAVKAIGSIGGAAALARTYESPVVRDALIRLAKTQRGSEEEYAAINRAIVQMNVATDAENRKKGAKK